MHCDPQNKIITSQSGARIAEDCEQCAWPKIVADRTPHGVGKFADARKHGVFQRDDLAGAVSVVSGPSSVVSGEKQGNLFVSGSV